MTLNQLLSNIGWIEGRKLSKINQ